MGEKKSLDNKNFSERSVYSLLGLSQKAGALVSGKQKVLDGIRSGKAGLVLISKDASQNTRKKFQDKCSYYHVPNLLFGEKEAIGRAIGTAAKACLAIMDKGFAKALMEKIRAVEEYGGIRNGEN